MRLGVITYNHATKMLYHEVEIDMELDSNPQRIVQE